MKKILENKKIKHTFYNVIKGVILFTIVFTILNLLIFVPLVQKELKNSLYPEARAYMVAAEKINEIYIFPLSHMTHWEHPITKPFYAIRDKLYNTGLSKFPDNEGEKEIWWYKIKYVEFRELVEDNLVAYQLNKDIAIPKFVYSKVGRFHDWDRELYRHIEPIASAQITDEKFAKFKLDMFVQLSRLYVSMDSLLVLEPRAISRQKTRHSVPLVHWVSDKEVEKYDEIYQTYIKLLEYSKKHDKFSYDYFYSDMNRRIWSWFLVHGISENIITSRFYNNKLSCEDKYFELYIDNHKIMKDYYDKFGKTLSYGVRARMSMDSGEIRPAIAYNIQNCKKFKDCTTIEQLRKYYNQY